MKTRTYYSNVKRRVSFLAFFTLFVFANPIHVFGQQLPECDNTVPFFILDLTATPDSTYTTPEIIRDGQCCGGGSNQNYVSFYVTLHPDVAMVEIGIASGYADPGGSGNYNIISGGDLVTPGVCGPDIDGGQPTCITGSGPHKITYYKPGNNKVKYYLKQIPKPIFPQDDTTRVGCSLPFSIYGLDSISITSINSSTGQTTPGFYDALLSCNDCSAPTFNPGLATPEWIDYVICGDPQAEVCGVFDACDTVRLYTRDLLEVNATPNPAEFCIGGSVLISASATGGDNNYSYNWYDSGGGVVSATDSYTATSSGTYTVEVSDGLVSSTCPAEYLSVPVTEGLLPVVDAGADITVCATEPETFLTGSVQNATGGTWSGGLGTFNPSPNSLLSVYTPTSAEISSGSVTLILTSSGAGGGCTDDIDSVTIYFSDTVELNPTFVPISCSGDSTVVNANASGGSGPFTYFWSTGESTASISVPAGAYSLTVEDTFGCSANVPVSVSEPSPIILNLSSTNTSTDIACDGTASVSISGGVGPYTVEWMDLQTNLTATGLCYGIATVTVTDALGCVSVGSVVVNNPTCSSFNVIASNTDLDCYADRDAQAFSFPSGGTAPYTFSWNTVPVQTTQDVANLPVGTYTVTVTDFNGCIDVASVTVQQPSVITNTMQHTDATSIGGNEGSATANPMGGTPGYTYLWNPSSQITQTASSLSAGVYYVNIQDGNSCLKVDSIQINEPPCNDFMVSVNVTNISCAGSADGSAYIVISQGVAPYSITWSNGPTDVTSVDGLMAGTYTVTVTDASNCTTFETFDITEPATLSPGLVPTNVSCFNAADGTIDLTVSGGTFPYSYSWSIGGSTIANHEDLVGLAPGTYSVSVTDNNGCKASGSAGITQPAQLQASYSYSDVNCYGDTNGSVDATVTGGVLPYSYSWTGPSGFSATTQDLSGLEPGLYELMVTDGNSCSISTPTQLYINEPDSVILVSYSIPCPAPGASDVVVTVDSISGGSGEPYQLSYDGGVTYGSSGVYNETLPLGASYEVLVLDGNGCISPDTTTMVVNPAIEITDIAFNPCIAVGTLDINITVTPNGGDGGPYEVSTDGGTTWNTAGTYVISVPVDATYNVLIRDGNGCLSTISTIVVPAPLDVSATLTNEVSCNGAADGSVDLSVSGGAAPYTYAWTGPGAFTSVSEDISGLVAGWYYYSVTDTNACLISDSIQVTTILDTTPPTITFCSGNQSEVTDPSACTYTVSGTAWDATGTDDCVVASIVYTLSGATTGSGTTLNGVAFNLGTTTVLWTITDGVGNTTACSFDVVVADDQSPVLVSCGAGGNQSEVVDSGVCTYTVSGTAWDAVATDNCTVATLTYALSGATTGIGTTLNGVSFNLGTTTVTWTATDGSGTTTTCSFDVTVTDDQLPAIVTCGPGGNQNVVADAGVCTYTVSGTTWDATATDNCTVASIEYTLSGATTGTGTSLDGVTFNLGTTTVLWTVTDNSNNTQTCSFDVTVTDDQLPAIVSCGASGNQNVNADFGSCFYTNSGNGWNATATDNCTVASIEYALSGATTGTGTTLNGVAFNLGTTTVVWTATDGSGNIATCTFDVIVSDNQDPVISDCGGVGTENVVTDPATCSYTVSGTGWDPTVIDNCTVASVTYALSGATTGTGTTLDGVSFNQGTTTVVWTATDGVGNASTCTFNVVVTDNQDPAIVSCGAVGTQNVVTDPASCSYIQTTTAWDATATDNCTVASITYTLSGATTGTGTTLSGVSFNLGTTTVVWTVADGSGNTETCTFDVVVTDNQDPAISSCGATGTQTVNANAGVCYYTHSTTAWDATATDNCSVSTIEYTLSGATTGTGTTLNGVSFNLGTTTVVWTVTDNAGNSSTCTFDVDVVDNQIPSITTCGPSGSQTVNADFGSCTYTYSGTGWNAIGTDNCSVATTEYTLSGVTIGTGTSLNGVSFNLGITNVLWTVTDGSGNTATCSFTVTVLDDQDPSVLSCGAVGTQNVSTDVGVCTYTQVGAGWDATADDNCSVASIAYTLSGATTGSGASLDGVAFAQGVTTVLWTVTDGSGNTTTCTFNVVVTDNEVPAISGCSGTINANNDNGACGAIVNWTPPTFTDNCGASMTSTHNPGDFFSVGTTTVTYTVADGAGNVSTCIFDVVVTDNELPQLTCSSNISSCDSLVTFPTPTASDNCGVVSVTQIAGLPSGSIFPVGTTTVTFEALDVNGNTNTCSFVVTINPTPILSTVDTDVSCNSFGDGSIDLTPTNGTPTYNFAWSNGATTEDISNLDPGIYSVTVTDAFGCSASISDTITQPALLTLNKEVTQVNCYGDSTGAIDLTISGGTLPYSFVWSNGATTEDISGLSVGTYGVTVTDANGCEVTDVTSIIQPDSISVVTVVSDATCNAANGAINTLVTGGTSPYDYSWSNGATTANLSNVQGGTYTLTITDNNSCVATITETVGSTANLTGEVYATDVLCNGGRTGEALVIINSGNAPYTFEWSTGDTLNPIEGLEAGSYSVFVQDAFGCEMTLNFDVAEPDELTVDLFSPEPLAGYNISLFGGSDGSIQSTVDGGTPVYSYQWSNGSTQESINGLTAGGYTLIVTDDNGCITTAFIELTEPLELAMPEGVSPNGDMQNDFFVIRGIEAYPNNLLTIYNRWGNVVYEQSGYDNDWQGQNNKGEPLPDGTYYAIFQPTGDGSVAPLTGYIDLRRNR